MPFLLERRKHTAFASLVVCASAHSDVRKLAGRRREQREDILQALPDTPQLRRGNRRRERQYVLRTLILDLVLEPFARARNGEALVVKQLLDAQHAFDVPLAVHALSG